MAVAGIRFRDPRDGARVAEALLVAADCAEVDRPLMAKRWRELADDLGDRLDDRPELPSACDPDPLDGGVNEVNR